MLKIITIIGTRPQFIKASIISTILKEYINEIIIHTGQHYDENMSNIFFEELEIQKPKYELNVGNKSSIQMITQMISKLEPILITEQPKYVLVYGDCDTTLAAALTANKLNIPIIHVEAGARSYDKTMPEEINRILVDNMSTYLLCVNNQSIINLQLENINDNVYLIGDPMCYLLNTIKHNLDLSNKYSNYYLLTLHRQSNTHNIETILTQINKLNTTIIYPIHPRIQLTSQFKTTLTNFIFLPPQSYYQMISLINNSIAVITDSGGLQKEAYILQKVCHTLRTTTEWPDLVQAGWNNLIPPNQPNLHQLITNFPQPTNPNTQYFTEDLKHLLQQFIKTLL
jgi:UDP-GlcNAc3NAcA epimerase